MNRKPIKHISHALELDGSEAALRQYYALWSSTYDDDLQGVYYAPYFLTDLIAQRFALWFPQSLMDEMLLLDVGCGTGKVGELLLQHGFNTIDGVDLSEEMIAVAQLTGAYRQLHSDVNINLDGYQQWHERYDLVSCCGVFTLGHVQPEALLHMLKFVKPEGVLVANMRLAYYQSTHIQQVCDELQHKGILELLEVIDDAPYTNDSSGKLWVLRKK